MLVSGLGEGFWGSGVDERKLAPSSLTVESRPHEQDSKTEPGASESGFLPGASADRGSHWVGKNPAKSLSLSLPPLPHPPYFPFDSAES